MRKLREKPSPGVSSVSFNRRLSKYCAICSKQSLAFFLESPTMVSLDYTRSAKSVITVAMIAVRFILIGLQSMTMRAVKMKPMPMKFLVVGMIKEVVVRGVVAKGIMIKEVVCLETLNPETIECRQGIRTSEAYTEEFYRLSARNNLLKSEDQQIAGFVNGLRVAIRDQVSLQTLYSLNEAVTLAKKVESQQNQTNTRSQFSNREKQPVPPPQS
ncbi:hypothetical protein Acr_23g0013330 [Actinidia rufa]|uniref:Uncharacterized protein n=1 Tax=Actinidia rufa TaxID=165716 RepID=A0A7J0GQC3_9ERIC|nr:hypothetical protein Acr_23g0013330 [Actinidia rufa]